MPKRTDIESILIIGSGPIVIGQACEFDYSGTQGAKSLRELGFRVVLVNSNPASIMTDPDVADRTYIEPLTVESLTAIIEAERPSAILPTLGGQTALNLALALHDQGILEKYNVELIGAKVDAIRKAEDRELFKEAMDRIGLTVAKSAVVHNMDEAMAALDEIGFPAILRPAFTLGGSGGNVAYNLDDYRRFIQWGLDLSPTRQILVETSLLGWKEYELEVIRDTADNVIIICSIENLDPMGVHTGDSITIAPAQTLTDVEYQRLRDASIAVIREIGVDTGGSNIQFAINPANGDVIVIEMNPRVSRSSALASKATGYPIAKVAAKLAVGLRLDEIMNDITGQTPAAFEPTIDYVVTKIPRFTFEKFPHTEPTLTTQMKSVGEVMAIGRTFTESLQKALRSMECGWRGLEPIAKWDDATLCKRISVATPDRLLEVAEVLRRGLMSIDELYHATAIDRWFLRQIEMIIMMEKELASTSITDISSATLWRAKSMGFGDERLAKLMATTETDLRTRLSAESITPTYHMVDTCAAEFEARTPYYYSAYEPFSVIPDVIRDPVGSVNTTKKIMVLGSGPNRIGQGIEFDYCCVHASLAIRESGRQSIMVNCNPETVSTDYDISDRLYFEPLTFENVMAIVDREKPSGVIVQFGGQTPLRLANRLWEAGVPIIGTSPDSIDQAEDRERFRQLIETLGLRQPRSATATTVDRAMAIAHDIGYPVMVRPSYVLGGRAMEVIYDDAQLTTYLTHAIELSDDQPVLIDQFLRQAIEVDVDAIGDGHDVLIGGIMEHIEEAGVHSGDSSCSIPPYSLSPATINELRRQTEVLARALNVIGLMNIQFAIVRGAVDCVYILEVNPRASRTVPFVSKAVGLPLAKMATEVMMGKQLVDLVDGGLIERGTSVSGGVAVKSPVFPFAKFSGVDTLLGPEMKSTGEVMGVAKSFGAAFAKAQTAAGNSLPTTGRVLISVRDDEKHDAMAGLAADLVRMGFSIVATEGTQRFLHAKGVPAVMIPKVMAGGRTTVTAIRDGEVALVINTTEGKQAIADSYSLRRAALECRVSYVTTFAGAVAAVEGIRAIRQGATGSVRAIQATPPGPLLA